MQVLKFIFNALILVSLFWCIFGMFKPHKAAPWWRGKGTGATRGLIAATMFGVWIVIVAASSALGLSAETPEEKAAREALEQQKAAAAQQEAEAKAAAAEQQKRDEKNYHYFDSTDLLQEMYTSAARSVGVGAPEVDQNMTDYQQGQNKDGGLIISSGKYTLSNEKGLTHEFYIEWAENSKIPVRVIIDGQKVMDQPELRDALIEEAQKKQQ